LIPPSLRGRLIASFVILSLAMLMAVGGTLFVVLRGLHADATAAGLGDVAGSILPQVRQNVGNANLRGALEDIRDELVARGITVMIVGADGRLRPIGGTPTGAPVMQTDGTAGDTLRGTVEIDGQRYLYAATVVRRTAATAPRAVAFLAVDQSAALALADLGRTIPAIAIVIFAIAMPLAWLVARSVTRPLERVAAAASDLPAGRHEPVPSQGPTEVRALTATFNAMAGELDATRQRETELLANLRHDLRTPLTVIAGFATALRDGTADGPAAAAAAGAIEGEAERMARLIDEMGIVEQIRSGEAGLRPEAVDVPALLDETIARFAARAVVAGGSLGRTSASAGNEADLSLTADRLALDRMLANLVANALGAIGPGGNVLLEAGVTRLPASSSAPEGSATARGSAAESGVAAVWMGVIDDGPGFAPGAAAHAFERFWRGDAARAGKGSGLGLAIVRELATAHGGTVYAENVSPRGARVGIILPRVPAPPSEIRSGRP
jgi:signal transduction histidine kinase